MLPHIYTVSASDVSAREIRVAVIRKFLVPDGQESNLQLILYEIQQQNRNDIVMNGVLVATQRRVPSKHKMMIKILRFPVSVM